MLNISDNNKHSTANLDRFKTKGLASRPYYKILNRLITIAVIVIVILFLPWTQNISGKGAVTTKNLPNDPQSIQSIISGRIEKWYVQEGDYVKR
jgi:multidrug efflux pump subunit AcrA (membrane-fusion protein)